MGFECEGGRDGGEGKGDGEDFKWMGGWNDRNMKILAMNEAIEDATSFKALENKIAHNPTSIASSCITSLLQASPLPLFLSQKPKANPALPISHTQNQTPIPPSPPPPPPPQSAHSTPSPGSVAPTAHAASP